MNPGTYLGDGLYASFDGYVIRLFTDRGDGTHEVFLEHQVLAAFERFVASQGQLAAERHEARLIDTCMGCSEPAHASETDDDGYHPQCRPETLADPGLGPNVAQQDELQRIPVITAEPVVARIARAFVALAEALPDVKYVTIASGGGVTISCGTDESTRALAASIGRDVREATGDGKRWLDAGYVKLGGALISIYGPHHDVVAVPTIDEGAVTADTITDEQIRELRRIVVCDPDFSSAEVDSFCHVVTCALDDGKLPHRIIREARARCAEILNARATAEPREIGDRL